MAAAILLNLVAGALAGAIVPIVLRRLSIDPALAGGVVLTTVTDVIGIVAFIGLATYILVGH
jgi:magnesium transporter